MAGADWSGVHVHQTDLFKREDYTEVRHLNGMELVNLLSFTMKIIKEMGMRTEETIEEALEGGSR